MGLATFKGGVHPFEGKELSMDKPVTQLKPTSGEMVYPLSQHIGAPADPCVQVGSTVQRGDVIARMADGALGADVHASVCGTVERVEDGMIVIRAK